MIVLDYRDSRPLYQQVKDSLRRMMLTGLLEPDEKLPSVRSLATQLAINPNTIQRAYAELEAEGYIYSVAGKGSFVSAGDGEHARRIAELTQQLRPLVEELKSLGWDAAIAACKAKQADAMIAGASITEKRKSEGWIFSDSYYTATQCMAVKEGSDIKSFDDLKGKTVAVKTGTMGETYAKELVGKYGFTITNFEDSPTMYQAVVGGQAVACFEDTPIMASSIKDDGYAMKIVEGSENEGAGYGVAVFSSDKQEFLDMFNKGLANIKASGKYDEIIKKYLG